MIKPEEIKDKNFSKKLNGFNPQEVNDFLNKINHDYKAMMDKVTKLEAENKDNQKTVNKYNHEKKTLNSSILIAQQAANDLKAKSERKNMLRNAKAEQNAKKIVSDAKQKSKKIITNTKVDANNILENAANKSNRWSSKIISLKNGTTDFRKKTLALSKDLLKFVESNDWDKALADGDIQSKKAQDYTSHVAKAYRESKAKDNHASNDDSTKSSKIVNTSVDKK